VLTGRVQSLENSPKLNQMPPPAHRQIFDRRVRSAIQFVPLGAAVAEAVEAETLQTQVEAMVQPKLVKLVVTETGGRSDSPGRVYEVGVNHVRGRVKSLRVYRHDPGDQFVRGRPHVADRKLVRRGNKVVPAHGGIGVVVYGRRDTRIELRQCRGVRRLLQLGIKREILLIDFGADAQEIRRGYLSRDVCELAESNALVAAEEEQFVFKNWAAQSGAMLVARGARLLLQKLVAGSVGGDVVQLEQTAAELVGSTLGDQVDIPGNRPTHGGRHDSLHHTYLLDGVLVDRVDDVRLIVETEG